jgi:hypothetical protein
MPEVLCPNDPTGATAVLPIVKIKTMVVFGAFRKPVLFFDLKYGFTQCKSKKTKTTFGLLEIKDAPACQKNQHS